jgi:integrase
MKLVIRSHPICRASRKASIGEQRTAEQRFLLSGRAGLLRQDCDESHPNGGHASDVLSQAIDDGLIGRNPVDRVKVPKRRPREQRYLTAEQVTELAGAVGQRMEGGDVLVILAYAGLRGGEAVALRVVRSTSSADKFGSVNRRRW